MKICFMSTFHPFLTLQLLLFLSWILGVPDKYTEKSYTLKGLLSLVGAVHTLQTLGNLEPAGKGRVHMDGRCQGSQNQRTGSDP
jgi:hypothetical protein